MLVFMNYGPQSVGVKPHRIAIPWFEDREIMMELGTSRVFEVLFFSENNNRTDKNFLLVTERAINWTAEPPGVVSVDLYGRVEPIKEGVCTLKVESLSKPGVKDSRSVRVVAKRNDTHTVPKRIVNYQGEPHPTTFNLQKFVVRFQQSEVSDAPNIPDSVKYASEHPSEKHQQSFEQGNISWSIKKYADGSGNSYLLRVNNSMLDSNRDKMQYFIGDRYLPDDAKNKLILL